MIYMKAGRLTMLVGIWTDDMRSIVHDIYEGRSIDYASRYIDRYI